MASAPPPHGQRGRAFGGRAFCPPTRRKARSCTCLSADPRACRRVGGQNALPPRDPTPSQIIEASTCCVICSMGGKASCFPSRRQARWPALAERKTPGGVGKAECLPSNARHAGKVGPRYRVVSAGLVWSWCWRAIPLWIIWLTFSAEKPSSVRISWVCWPMLGARFGVRFSVSSIHIGLLTV